MDAPVLVIFEFELARAENSVVVDDIRSYGTFDDPIAFTLEQLAGMAGRRVALDRSTLPVARYGSLVAGLDGYEVTDAFGLVEGVRLVKSEDELRLMERAAALTDVGVAAATAEIGQGVEDRAVAAAIVDAMYRAGSDTMCWGPIVAAGYRAGAAHSTFNGHRIGRGETVFLELTGEASRYVSPLMRTVVAGEPSADMLRVEAAVTAALEVIRTNALPGASSRDVAARGLTALESVLEGHIFHHYFGYPVGIGYPPSWIEALGFFIRADNDRPLERGMTFHLPMSIRKYGEYGVNLSHTLVVEEGGARVLGSSPARLAVV
jgi:Xaa-Pro dipeptidase